MLCNETVKQETVIEMLTNNDVQTKKTSHAYLWI